MEDFWVALWLGVQWTMWWRALYDILRLA